ncbi:hypothetical protein [Halosolutus gelatinilyticus]|uniref:hypothetical protein n=1 Tax=Halosolutus gelatinilyticus TaxID=2931975 RepID=UPI001FF24F91|nr:hypothetical protein [Halosolutus gelatinilyticus]
MKEIESMTIHPFGDGLLVELIGIDEHDDVSTVTIEFDIVDDNGEAAAREDIPSNYKEDVKAVLSKNGYSISNI